MKHHKLMIVFVLMFGLFIRIPKGSAQTWEELFRQKETQREYLILQIGGLEIQSQLLAESASIAKTGLDAVGNWKGLEKEIHALFFDSFKKVGPVSQSEYERMVEFGISPEGLLSRIESSNRYWEKELPGSDFLEASQRIHSDLRSRCLKKSNELEAILGNELELEDADRAKRIKGLFGELEVLHGDLMRVQVLLIQRMYMDKQKMKWQKEQNKY